MRQTVIQPTHPRVPEVTVKTGSALHVPLNTHQKRRAVVIVPWTVFALLLHVCPPLVEFVHVTLPR